MPQRPRRGTMALQDTTPSRARRACRWRSPPGRHARKGSGRFVGRDWPHGAVAPPARRAAGSSRSPGHDARATGAYGYEAGTAAGRQPGHAADTPAGRPRRNSRTAANASAQRPGRAPPAPTRRAAHGSGASRRDHAHAVDSRAQGAKPAPCGAASRVLRDLRGRRRRPPRGRPDRPEPRGMFAALGLPRPSPDPQLGNLPVREEATTRP